MKDNHEKDPFSEYDQYWEKQDKAAESKVMTDLEDEEHLRSIFGADAERRDQIQNEPFKRRFNNKTADVGSARFFQPIVLDKTKARKSTILSAVMMLCSTVLMLFVLYLFLFDQRLLGTIILSVGMGLFILIVIVTIIIRKRNGNYFHS